MLRKQVVLSKKVSLSYILRYGLVVRIPGSHPGGPGSIPGNGKLFEKSFLLESTFEFLCAKAARQTIQITQEKYCVGRESNPDQLLGRQLC